MMNDSHLYDEVISYLVRWQRRRLWADVLLWLPRGLLAGLVAAAAVAALARFQPVLHNREVALITLAMALLGLAGSALIIYLRQPATLEQARYFDRLFKLQERASTAVEIGSGRLPVDRTLAKHQLVDTRAAMSRVDASTTMRLRPRWGDVLLIFLAAILLFLAMILPNVQSSILAERQAVAAAVDEEIVRLQALAQRIEEAPALDEADRQALLEPIRSTLEELNAGQLSREEAVAALSAAEAELRELAEARSGRAGAEALQAAGQPLAADSSSTDMGQAMAGGDLAQAAVATGQLADRLKSISPAERNNLATALQESAARLVEVDPELASALAEAARALQRDQLDQAQQALRQAAETLQQQASGQVVGAQALEAADEFQAARGEVAAAGSPAGMGSTADGGQSGQGGSGEGQVGQGATAVTGVSAGAGADAGAGISSGAGSETAEGQGAGGPGPGGGHADTVYVPDTVDLSAQDGVEIQLPAECVANPETCGPLINESPAPFTDEQSLVPYQQVFGDYRNAAFEALESDYVPLGLKGLVRDYFSSLEP